MGSQTKHFPANLLLATLLTAWMISFNYSWAQGTSGSPSIELCGLHNVRTINLYDKRLFVLIENKTKAPIKIWREQSSWGWGNISLEVRSGTHSLAVVRREVAWDKNVPVTLILQPSDVFVREIDLQDSSWQWSSVVNFCKKNPNPTISAKFKISDEQEAKKAGIWIGSIASSKPCLLQSQ